MALRELAGSSLVARAVLTLLHSGAVDRVVVAVPRDLAEAVRELVAPVATSAAATLGVDVLPVPPAGAREDAPGTLGLLDLIRAGTRTADGGLVVVHDPLQPLVPPSAVRDVVAALDAAPERAAAVQVREVTDTVKWVTGEPVGGLVAGTADREAYRVVAGPQAYRLGALRSALTARSAVTAAREPRTGLDPADLPRLVLLHGGEVHVLPLAQEPLRITGGEDLLLARAVLDLAAAGVT